MLKEIMKLYPHNSTSVVAPSGVAACLHQTGQTLQGYYKLGISTKQLAPIGKKSKELFRIEREKIKCDIVDEVFMCKGKSYI
jgi:hypothetical protein